MSEGLTFKVGSGRILSELEAKEAAMNGERVTFRRFPPYLRCSGCGGDGTDAHPYLLECLGPHDPGWQVVDPLEPEQ